MGIKIQLGSRWSDDPISSSLYSSTLIFRPVIGSNKYCKNPRGYK